ncbi:unnamed protein product [Heligmosomoides polygyrus]|uniref:EB domain-containing protein n=1 Tax=Heligmosomoides polygyrus TaxID=6339 RepID=A0A183GQL4_HELPZ|nr:unnamed protein product [Heligmosomoides polygyrus]
MYRRSPAVTYPSGVSVLARSITREYRRPQCTSEQTCSYEAFGMIFALCDCPGDDPICPRDPRNAIEHRGTVYNFCYPRSAPICEDGQVSTTVSGIQTAIHCICSDSNDLVQQPTKLKDVTSYMCRQVIIVA